MKKKFTKDDLQSGMIVEIRGGASFSPQLGLVVKNGNNIKFLVRNGFLDIVDYTDDLFFSTDIENSNHYDIIKVYIPNVSNCIQISSIFNSYNLKCIWRRPIVKKIKRSDIIKAFNIKENEDFEIID